MEDGVTFGWRTEYLKYMAKTSIAGGDYKVARKYIDMLKRTLFHKEWAEKYETYLDHPEQIRKSKEFAPIIRLLPKEDKLNSDLNQEAAYLYGHLENKVDISHMPFDQEVKDSYQRFMEFTQQCAGMTEAQMAEAFRPQFGNTFYYFYFLVNGLQTY